MSSDGVQLVGHQCTARAVRIIEHVRIVDVGVTGKSLLLVKMSYSTAVGSLNASSSLSTMRCQCRRGR